MFCNNCGYNNENSAMFCVNCGASLETQPQNTSQGAGYNGQPNPQQGYGQSQYYYNQYIRPETPGKAMSIASMILGIVSIIFFCIFYISIPSAAIGIALGIAGCIKANNTGIKNGYSIAGIICSAIGIFLSIVFLALIILNFSDFASYAEPALGLTY